MDACRAFFSAKLGTNYAPTEEELRQLSQLLLPLEQQRSSLHNQVQDLETELARLKNDYNKISDQIYIYRQFATPARRLPRDILHEVFLHCLPDHCPFMDYSCAPLLLTHVCRDWRDQVLRTPRLWAKIHIVVPGTVAHHYHSHQYHWGIETARTAEAVKSWLDRSGACPLEISVHADLARDWYAWLEKGLAKMGAVIMAYRSRWRKVLFEVPEDLLCMWIQSVNADESLPLLEELLIAECPSIHSQSSHWAYIFQETPRLQRLTIFGFLSSTAFTEQSVVPWANLTHIEFLQSRALKVGLNPDSIFQALKRCLSLVVCKIDFAGSHIGWKNRRQLDRQNRLRNGVDPGLAPISFPHLEEFSISDGSYDLTCYFRVMEVPRLQSLRFEHDARWEFEVRRSDESDESGYSSDEVLDYGPAFDKNLTCIAPLLLKTSQTLTSLTLSIWFISKDRMMRYLELCPLLTSLTFIEDSVTPNREASSRFRPDDGFLLSLITQDATNKGYVLPYLEELDMSDCCTDLEITDAGLLEFIVRKQTTGGSLRKLRYLAVRFCREPEFSAINPGKVDVDTPDGTDASMSTSLRDINYEKFKYRMFRRNLESQRLANQSSGNPNPLSCDSLNQLARVDCKKPLLKVGLQHTWAPFREAVERVMIEDITAPHFDINISYTYEKRVGPPDVDPVVWTSFVERGP